MTQEPQILKEMGGVLAEVDLLRSLVQKPAVTQALKAPISLLKLQDIS